MFALWIGRALDLIVSIFDIGDRFHPFLAVNKLSISGDGCFIGISYPPPPHNRYFVWSSLYNTLTGLN